MSTQQLNISEWNSVKSRLKWNFKHLTEKDLAYSEGKEAQLIDRLGKKLGAKPDDVIEIINRIAK